jgi:hypothetical protein
LGKKKFFEGKTLLREELKKKKEKKKKEKRKKKKEKRKKKKEKRKKKTARTLIPKKKNSGCVFKN